MIIEATSQSKELKKLQNYQIHYTARVRHKLRGEREEREN